MTCDLCQFQELRWFEEEGEESLRSHAPLSVDHAHPRAEFAEAVVSTLFLIFICKFYFGSAIYRQNKI